MDFTLWVPATLRRKISIMNGPGWSVTNAGFETVALDRLLFIVERLIKQAPRGMPQAQIRAALEAGGRDIPIADQRAFENARALWRKRPRAKRDNRWASLRIYHIVQTLPTITFNKGDEWEWAVERCYIDPRDGLTPDGRVKVHYLLKPLRKVRRTVASAYRERGTPFRYEDTLFDEPVRYTHVADGSEFAVFLENVLAACADEAERQAHEKLEEQRALMRKSLAVVRQRHPKKAIFKSFDEFREAYEEPQRAA